MIELTIFNQKGEKSGLLPVPACFILDEINQGLIWEIVVAENAAKRQGTHSTKSRGLVRGGGAKPWRQKGTGRARAGSNRSPIWRGGGVVFGPTPRDYSKNVSYKKKRVAFRHILAEKISQDRVVLAKGFSLDQIKTSKVSSFLKSILPSTSFSTALNSAKKHYTKKMHEPLLYVSNDLSESEKLSFRNIPWIRCVNVRLLSPASVFYASGTIISDDALGQLVERLNPVSDKEKGV